MPSTRIAKILGELITEKKISVNELAKRVKLPQPTVYRIVTGACVNPHLSTLKPLADFFDITVDQLKGLDPLKSLDHSTHIPLLTLKEAIDWPRNRSKLKQNEMILTDAKISKNAYSIQVKDEAMEPAFAKGTWLILDPEKEPKNRSYVLAKLSSFGEPIFRQLILDINNRYLKPLTPDLERYKMTILNNNDKILSTLVQAKRDYED